MRGKVVFTLASVALLSCRAVLGIEDLEETGDGGKTPTADSGTDTGPKPGTDAGSDAPVNACVAQGSMCGKCCRDKDMQSNKQLQDLLAVCACDGGCGPTNDCNGTLACPGGTVEPGTTACVPCLDRVIKADSCKKAKDDCAQSAGCKAVYDCVHGCP